MLEKVIFDTNKLRDKEANLWSFFGNRAQLEFFSKVSEVIIPDVVFEELKRQKKRSLEGKKQSFLENPIHWILGTSKTERENFDIDIHIQKLVDEENIIYSLIELTDYSVLSQMKELALAKEPPFENWENTDKWFKDAYIYFTILKYLETIDDQYVYVCTRDWRLKEALSNHSRIKIIEDFNEFQKWRISYFQEEYFLKELSTKTDWEIKKEFIVNVRININGNRIIEAITDWPALLVEVDFATKEIIDYIVEDLITEEERSLSDLIKNLIDSNSFDNTDYCIYYLTDLTQYLKDEEIIKIIEASVLNNQIYWIADKDALKSFFKPLFEYKKKSLDEQTQSLFIKYFWE